MKPLSEAVSSSTGLRREVSSVRTSSSSRFATSTQTQLPHQQTSPLHSPYSFSSPSSRQILRAANRATTVSSLRQPLLNVTATSLPLRLGDHNFSTVNTTDCQRKLYSPSGGAQVSPATTCSCSCGDDGAKRHGLKELLYSLALMCLLSMLMAFLALVFLQRSTPTVSLASEEENAKVLKTSSGVSSSKVSPITVKEYVRVSNFSVTLSTLTLSLNLCCLFVSCIQFLSAIKLLKTPGGNKRTHDFLKKTSHVRITAIGSFLISIPIFFTGVILFTFINFDEMPALVTSIVIGIGILFCGMAAVQNVYLWQKEKTRANKETLAMNLSSRISHPVLLNNTPPAANKTNQTHSGYFPFVELSTLV